MKTRVLIQLCLAIVVSVVLISQVAIHHKSLQISGDTCEDGAHEDVCSASHCQRASRSATARSPQASSSDGAVIGDQTALTLEEDRIRPLNVSRRTQIKPASVAIVSAYFRPESKQENQYYDQLFQIHFDSIARYANYHSYPHFYYNSHFYDTSHKCHWSKLPVISTHLHYYDWVLWIDTDAVICNFDTLIEDILDRADDAFQIYEKEKYFLVAHDHFSMNAGIILIRNTEWSHQILQKAWDWRSPRFQLNEQDALLQVFHIQDNSEHVQRLPTRWINSFKNGGVNRPLGREARSLDYRPGDFILHVAGLELEQKLKEMRALIPSEVPGVNIVENRSQQWKLVLQPMVVERTADENDEGR